MTGPGTAPEPLSVALHARWRRLQSSNAALQEINRDLCQGDLIASRDGKEYPRGYWRRAEVVVDPAYQSAMVIEAGRPAPGEWFVRTPAECLPVTGAAL